MKTKDRCQKRMAQCTGCGAEWNISIYQKIPKDGYMCPDCRARLKKGEKPEWGKIKPIRYGRTW